MNKVDNINFRKETIRTAKTELILDAALEVLSQKGYYETRLEDIAEKAGFSKSALYRYYKDKDEIFFNSAIREVNKMIEKLSTPPYQLSESNHISVNLRNLLSVSFETLGDKFSFILTMNSFQVISLISNLRNRQSLIKNESDFLASQNKLKDIMVALFDSAKAKGEITSSLDSSVLFDFHQGIYFSKIKSWYQQRQMGDITETINELLTFLSNGFGFEYNNTNTIFMKNS